MSRQARGLASFPSDTPTCALITRRVRRSSGLVGAWLAVSAWPGTLSAAEFTAQTLVGHQASPRGIALTVAASPSTAAAFGVGLTFDAPTVPRFDVRLGALAAVPEGTEEIAWAETEDGLLVWTDEAVVSLRRDPFSAALFRWGTADAVQLPPGFLVGVDDAATPAPDGAGRSAVPVLQEMRLRVGLDGSERLFGLGGQYGRVQKRGAQVEVIVRDAWRSTADETYVPVPWYVSTRGYGVLVDSHFPSVFQLGRALRADLSDGGDEDAPPDSVLVRIGAIATRPLQPGLQHGVDWREIAGTGGFAGFAFHIALAPSPIDAIESLARVTGALPMPALWTLAPRMSRNSYQGLDIVWRVHAAVHDHDLPVGAAVQEGIPWCPVGPPKACEHGRPQDPTDLASVRQVADALAADGVRLVVWTLPVIVAGEPWHAPAYERYMVKRADGGTYVIPEPHWKGNESGWVVDLTDPEARAWYAGLYDGVVTQGGVGALKTDGSEHLFSTDLVFADGRRGWEMKNAYPRLYTETLHAHLRQLTGEAGILWSRAGFTGSQAAPLQWAGDQASTFEELQGVVRYTQSAAASGISLTGSDIGGYDGPLDVEVYVRWAQFGALSPLMQTHGTTDREPWLVGGPQVLSIYRRYAWLRMSLMPYLVSQVRRAHERGTPLVRPMGLAWPGDADAAAYDEQYLLGPDLLVAPVLTAGASTRRVYLPAGRFLGLWDHRVHAGGGPVDFPVTLEDLVALVREGAVLPLNLSPSLVLGESLRAGALPAFGVYGCAAGSTGVYDDAAGGWWTIEHSCGPFSRRLAATSWTSQGIYILDGGSPSAVLANGAPLPRLASRVELLAAERGWCADPPGTILVRPGCADGAACDVTFSYIPTEAGAPEPSPAAAAR